MIDDDDVGERELLQSNLACSCQISYVSYVSYVAILIIGVLCNIININKQGSKTLAGINYQVHRVL